LPAASAFSGSESDPFSVLICDGGSDKSRRSNDRATASTVGRRAPQRACREIVCAQRRAASLLGRNSVELWLVTRVSKHVAMFTARRALANCRRPFSTPRGRTDEAKQVPLSLDTPSFLHRTCHLTGSRRCAAAAVYHLILILWSSSPALLWQHLPSLSTDGHKAANELVSK